MEKNEPALKLEEALAYHEANKKPSEISITKIDLAKKLFVGAKHQTQAVNMNNLVKGTTARVAPEWIKTICEATGVDANFLFGIEPMKEQIKK